MAAKQRSTPPTGSASAGSPRPPPPPPPLPPKPKKPDLDQSYLASMAALGDSDAESGADVDDGVALPASAPTSARQPAVAAWHQQESSATPAARTAIPRAVGARIDVRIPFGRSPARVTLGVLAIAAGVALLVFYLPTHAPSTAERATGEAYVWRFTDDLYLRARLAAGALMAVGLLFAATGVWFRPQSQVLCRRCRQWVVAARDGISLRCPRSHHVAGYHVWTILLVGALLAAVIGVVLSISFGSIIRG